MSIILLNISSFTLSLMIRIVIPIAICFYLLFCFQNIAGLGQGLVSISSHTSFSTSIVFIRSDHHGQLLKQMSFS